MCIIQQNIFFLQGGNITGRADIPNAFGAVPLTVHPLRPLGDGLTALGAAVAALVDALAAQHAPPDPAPRPPAASAATAHAALPHAAQSAERHPAPTAANDTVAGWEVHAAPRAAATKPETAPRNTRGVEQIAQDTREQHRDVQ